MGSGLAAGRQQTGLDSSNGSAPGNLPPSWRERLASRIHSRKALAEQERARSERDAARRALKAARAERDAAREELAATRAERDAAHDALVNARNDRDRSYDALAAARDDRDAAYDALATARAERDAFSATLERTYSEGERVRVDSTRLERQTADLVTEVRALRTLQRTTDRRVMSLNHELLTDFQALHQLFDRYAPEARLPPVGGWAVSPSGLLALVDVIEAKRAQTVVECGSGTSTLWIGYALKRLGRGRVVALDHIPEYAEKTRAMVEAHGLSDFVEVRLAPLAPRTTRRGEFSWYDFDAAEVTEPIDVLLVDGPPQATGPHARYPALSVFADHLALGATIIADDTHRPDEKEMLEYWLEEEPGLLRIESPGRGIEMFDYSGPADAVAAGE